MSESLSGSYHRNAVVADEAELRAWAADQMAKEAAGPTVTPTAGAEKLGPPKPTAMQAVTTGIQQRMGQPSALMAGAKATVQAANEGAGKAIKGLWDIFRYTPPAPEDVGQGVVREVASSFKPKAEGIKNVFHGLLGLMLSPAAGAQAASLQAEMNADPQRASAEVLPGGQGGLAPLVRAMVGGDASDKSPMTYGELASTAVSLATMGVMSTRGEKGRVKGNLIPEPAERVPQPALETGQIAKALPETTPATRAGGAIPQPAGQAVAGPKALPAGDVLTMGKSAEGVWEVVPKVETDFSKIIAGASDMPVADLEVFNAKTQAMLAEMYGELKDATPGSRTFVRNKKGTKVESVVSQPSTYPDYLIDRTRKGADRMMEEIQAAIDGNRDERAMELIRQANDRVEERAYREAADSFKAFGEEGKADPAVLARVAIGAAIGCATAEDAEGCAKRALVGAGVGAVLSGKLATSAVERLRTARAPGMEKASQRSGVSVQASEQPYQPNYQRLDLTPAVRNLMVTVHRSLKEDILERRGPAKTNDATVREALRRIETEKFTPERVLTLGDEEVLAAEDITAARILSKRAFEHAIEIRDKILAGEPVPEGSYKQAVSLAGAMGRNTRVAQTRQAQALQANKIKLGDERVSYRPEDVAHLADEMEPGMTDQQMAMLHSAIKSPDQMGKVATFLSVFPRAGLQALYFSYLSGKATLRNVVGNATMMGLDVMDTGIGRFMPTWDKRQRIMPGEATVRARAMGEALVDHVRMIRHLDAMDAEAVRLGFGDTVLKSEQRQPAMRDLALSMGAEEGGALARLGDWADRITTFPGQVLDRTDMASKAINGRAELHSQAMYQAAREGLQGGRFWDRVGELTDDPTKLSQSARQRIIEVGEEATFTKEFEGRIMRALASGPENEWLNGVYRGFVMPFFRVTARMTEQGMARTPGLNLAARQFWDDFLAGGVRRQKAEARVVGGAAVLGSFMYLESQGVLTGNAPKDPRLREVWEKAGYQQRSFWDGISEKWRSYDGLGPLTTLISTAADTSMAARKLPEDSFDGAHLLFSYFLSQVNNLDSRTFTQSISNLMDVIKNPSSDSQVEKAMDFLRKQVAGWAKPGVAREIETLVDPEVRRPVRSGAYDEDSLTGSLGREFQMLLDDVRSGWPGFSDAKDEHGNFLVPPAQDPITGDDTIVESWPFNPFPGRSPKVLPFNRPENMPREYAADVRQELLRLNGAGLEPIHDWIGGSNPGSGSGFSAGNLKEGIRLTGQAKKKLIDLMTKEVRDENGLLYKDALKGQMEEPYYWAQSDGSRGTDGGKATLLQAIETKFRTMAEEQLFEIAPGIKRRIDQRRGERAIQKVPTEQQPEVRDALQNLLKSLGR